MWIKNVFAALACALLAVLVSGCSVSPWLKDAWDRPDYDEAELSEDQKIRLGYLSRYLADSDTRARLESRVLQTQYVRQWNAHENATNASMAADVLQGQIASDLGAGIGAAVLVVGLLSGDGSLDYISQAFLPATINGESIKTGAQAQQVAYEMIQTRLEAAAVRLGTQLECVAGCGSEVQSVYVLKLPLTKPGEAFVYWPADIVITVDVGEVVAVPEEDPISALVRFPVAWKTQPGDGASVRLYGEGRYDEAGNLEFEPSSRGERKKPVTRYPLESTAIGQAILAEIYTDTQLIWGTQKVHPGMVFFEGQVRGFISNGRVGFVEEKVDVRRLR